MENNPECWVYVEIKLDHHVQLCCGDCGTVLLTFQAEDRSDAQPDRPQQVRLAQIDAAVWRHYARSHPERIEG